jgi:antitoxin ParD1/3/4
VINGYEGYGLTKAADGSKSNLEVPMPNLNVNLTPALSDFIDQEVTAGKYQSASDMVRDALRRLRRAKEREVYKLERLRREIDRGLDDANAGRFSSLSLEEIAATALGD